MTDLMPFTHLINILFRARRSEYKASRHLWDQVAQLKPEVLYTIAHETPLSTLLTTVYNDKSLLSEYEVYILKLHCDVIRANVSIPYSSFNFNCANPLHMISFCHRLFHPSDFNKIVSNILHHDQNACRYQDSISGNNPLHTLCTAPVLPHMAHQTVTQLVVPSENHESEMDSSTITAIEAFVACISDKESVLMQANILGELPLHLFLQYAAAEKDLHDPDRNERIVSFLSSVCDQSAGTIDPTQQLYPFMLAATKIVNPRQEWSITTVFNLLKKFVAVRDLKMIQTTVQTTVQTAVQTIVQTAVQTTVLFSSIKRQRKQF